MLVAWQYALPATSISRWARKSYRASVIGTAPWCSAPTATVIHSTWIAISQRVQGTLRVPRYPSPASMPGYPALNCDERTRLTRPGPANNMMLIIFCRMRAMPTPASPSKRELTHERILDAASRAIRRAGHTGASVAEVMKEAGLTHGGFYAHFDSREKMVASAIAHAGTKSAQNLAQSMAVLEKEAGRRSGRWSNPICPRPTWLRSKPAVSSPRSARRCRARRMRCAGSQRAGQRAGSPGRVGASARYRERPRRPYCEHIGRRAATGARTGRRGWRGAACRKPPYPERALRLVFSSAPLHTAAFQGDFNRTKI